MEEKWRKTKKDPAKHKIRGKKREKEKDKEEIHIRIDRYSDKGKRRREKTNKRNEMLEANIR